MFRRFVTPVTIMGVLVSLRPLNMAENTAMMENPIEPERMIFKYSFAASLISSSRFGKMFSKPSENIVSAVRRSPVKRARKIPFHASVLNARLLPAPRAFATVTVTPMLAAMRTT